VLSTAEGSHERLLLAARCRLDYFPPGPRAPEDERAPRDLISNTKHNKPTIAAIALRVSFRGGVADPLLLPTIDVRLTHERSNHSNISAGDMQTRQGNGNPDHGHGNARHVFTAETHVMLQTV